jgi:hypothetical protein
MPALNGFEQQPAQPFTGTAPWQLGTHSTKEDIMKRLALCLAVILVGVCPGLVRAQGKIQWAAGYPMIKGTDILVKGTYTAVGWQSSDNMFSVRVWQDGQTLLKPIPKFNLNKGGTTWGEQTVNANLAKGNKYWVTVEMNVTNGMGGSATVVTVPKSLAP